MNERIYTPERDKLWKLTNEITKRPDEFLDNTSRYYWNLTDHAQHVVAFSVMFPHFKLGSIEALAKVKILTERLIQLDLTNLGNFIARCPVDGYEEAESLREERRQLLEFFYSQEDLATCSDEQACMINAVLREDFDPIWELLADVADMSLC